MSKGSLNWPLTVFQAYKDIHQSAHCQMSSSNSAGSENETLTVSKQTIIAKGKEGKVLPGGTIPGSSPTPVLFYKKLFQTGRDSSRQRKKLKDFGQIFPTKYYKKNRLKVFMENSFPKITASETFNCLEIKVKMDVPALT